jgi:hypothetical protein
MIAIFVFLLVLTLSLLVVRVATVALVHTGLSEQVARFQALSAFSGTGYTTAESEMIVNHPVRRQIVRLLIRYGNAGLVTALATMVVTMIDFQSARSDWHELVLLLVGILLLWLLAASKWVDAHLSRVINWALARYTRIDTQDYANLLHVRGDFKVVEMPVEAQSVLLDHRLADIDLGRRGMLVLGITRKNGSFVGAPHGSDVIRAGDRLILYGQTAVFENFDQQAPLPQSPPSSP